MRQLLPASRCTVGLFIGSSEDRYENAILRGASHVLNQVGANLVCLTSGGIQALRGFEAQRNVLYELVHPQRFDGLMITGTLGHSIDAKEMAHFCHRFSPLPVVGIALDVPDIPSVLVDSRSGMRAVFDHLLDVHGYRRLAFIRGPLGQHEAEDRYTAYLDALAAHDIAFDPLLVVNGSYTRASGIQAAHQLLDQCEPGIEAIVSANDAMALGAMDVLQTKNLQVPTDLAVTGFDDTEDARYSLPPLTTVRQAVYEQGAQAAELLLSLLGGNSVADRVLAPAHLVVRQSCGCFSAAVVQAGAALPLDLTQSVKAKAKILPAHIRSKIQQAIVKTLPAQDGRGWISQIVDVFCDELENHRREHTLATLNTLLYASLRSEEDGQLWQAVVSELRRQALSYFDDLRDIREIESLSQQMRVLIFDAMLRLQASQRLEIEQQTVVLREVSESLGTTFDLSGLLDVIAQELPRLKIDACYLSLYENPSFPAGEARLILAYDDGRINLPVDGVCYPSFELVPPAFFRQMPGYTVIVEALHAKEDQLGFAVLKTPPQHAALGSVLRSLFSTSLREVLLLKQRIEAEKELLTVHQELEQRVKSRTAELMHMNAALQVEIAERKRVEWALRQGEERLKHISEAATAQMEAKAAELEKMAYSMAHDLKAPLRSIDGYSRLLMSDYAERLDEEGRAFLSTIRSATLQMNQLIEDLLAYYRLEKRQFLKSSFQLLEFVEEIVMERSEEIQKRGVQVVINLPRQQIKANVEALTLVLRCVLDNALKFTRQVRRPIIEIGGRKEAQSCILWVKDNGIGFDMQYHDLIFELFQRLNPAEDYPGTGVGLALAQKAMQRMHGHIWAESQPGDGSTFYLEIADES